MLGKPVESGTNNSSRLVQLQSTLDLYQNLYINLLGSLETVRLARLQNTPNIVQIEPAAAPEAPIRPRPLMNTALAAAVGLMLAAGLVFLIEYLDDTLKTPDEVERTLGIPVLGFVAEMQYKDKSAEEVYVSRQPRSPVSEAFRSLRTNLEFAGVERPFAPCWSPAPDPRKARPRWRSIWLPSLPCQGNAWLCWTPICAARVHRLLSMTNRDGLSDSIPSPGCCQLRQPQ